MLLSSPVAVIVLTLFVNASPASTIQFPNKEEENIKLDINCGESSRGGKAILIRV